MARKAIWNCKSQHPLYAKWHAMKARCHNEHHPQYESYGKKGIVVYEVWFEDFLDFYFWAIHNGYKKGYHLDRIESSKGYFPDNCQFLEPNEHARKSNCERRNIPWFPRFTEEDNAKLWRGY